MPYGADKALVKAAHVVSRLVDCRPAPYVDDTRGQRGRGAAPHRQGLGDPSDEVTVEKPFPKQASVSPTGAPLWDVLDRVVDGHYPEAKLLSLMIVGFTDAPHFHEHGAVAHGFGVFSRALMAEAMSSRFHGNDERVDVDSLALTTQTWLDTCEEFPGL